MRTNIYTNLEAKPHTEYYTEIRVVDPQTTHVFNFLYSIKSKKVLWLGTEEEDYIKNCYVDLKAYVKKYSRLHKDQRVYQEVVNAVRKIEEENNG